MKSMIQSIAIVLLALAISCTSCSKSSPSPSTPSLQEITDEAEWRWSQKKQPLVLGVNPHTCKFQSCPMKGDTLFKGCGDCEEGGDCWYLDLTHYNHPDWDYDQCEEYTFGKGR